MDVGDFDFDLKPTTPGYLLDAMSFFGSVLVTPVWKPTFTASEVQDAAIYAGLKFGHSGSRRTSVHGYGLAALWGPMPSEVYLNALAGTDTDTFSNLIRTYVIGTSGGSPGALIKEGSLGTGVATKTVQPKWGRTGLQILNHLCARFGDNEWRINPDQTLDAKSSSALFGTSPVAVFSPLYSGREGGILSYLSEIKMAEDVDTWIDVTAVLGDDAGASGSGLYAGGTTTFFTVDGELIRRTIAREDGQAPDYTAAQDQAVGDYSLMEGGYTHFEVAVTVLDEYAIRADIQPGNWCGLYDPDQGMFDGTADGIHMRGGMIYPRLARIERMEWAIREGMGVWFIHHDGVSATLYDLTPYVLWETDNTRLTVGASPRKLRASSFNN